MKYDIFAAMYLGSDIYIYIKYAFEGLIQINITLSNKYVTVYVKIWKVSTETK